MKKNYVHTTLQEVFTTRRWCSYTPPHLISGGWDGHVEFLLPHLALGFFIGTKKAACGFTCHLV